MRRFTYKGRYTPKNPNKYMGNSKNIIYRSLWERRFMTYCDNNESVLCWASEELIIPYISPIDNKMHKYYPDFLIKVDRSGKTQTVVIEVKPQKETKAPKKRNKITPRYLYEMKTWSINAAKWKYAREFCEERKWEFKILTEAEVGK
tara:strand:- start:48 stop:488 length:441 start_codon:yes stop_codon:yes gene_type:complete